jgi:hypothetical protein
MYVCKKNVNPAMVESESLDMGPKTWSRTAFKETDTPDSLIRFNAAPFSNNFYTYINNHTYIRTYINKYLCKYIHRHSTYKHIYICEKVILRNKYIHTFTHINT